MLIHKRLLTILKVLFEEKAIIDIVDKTGLFYDEPSLFHYVAIGDKEFEYYNPNRWSYSGQSVSLDREMALLKCLVESIEKLSTFLFKESGIRFAKYSSVTLPHLQFEQYISSFSGNSEKIYKDATFGFVLAQNLFENKTGLVPAQLIYPNYYQYAHYDESVEEPLLIYQPQVQNGVAADFDKELALLRAINEVIERDAFTTLHLAKHIPRLISLQKFKNTKLNDILDILDRYKLQAYVFDITNDLEIPVFMTILIDETGVGPLLNLGFRTGLNVEETILSSIEDTFYSRYCMRQDLVMGINKNQYQLIRNIKIGSLNYKKGGWVKKRTWETIEYLIRNFPTNQDMENNDYPQISAKDFFAYTCERIKKSGHEIWYKELKNRIVNQLNLHAVKVLIPGLQPPLFKKEYINHYKIRLTQASKYYNSSK